MRGKKNGAKREQGPLGWLALALVCILMLCLGRSCQQSKRRYVTTEEAEIPNDMFASWGAAQPAEAGEDEAKEAFALKIVCLTFDDGPSSNTENILTILKQYDVPATFFVTAQDTAVKYLPLTADIVADGHQLALHTASHQYSKIYSSSDAFWMDIKQLRQALTPYVNVENIHWLRFPGGSTNTISHRYGGSGIMKQLISECETKGYEWIDWNVCAEDATASHPNAAQILRNIQRDAASRDICVVLMHDTKATAETVKALPQIITWFQEQGYHFFTVEEMYETRDGA